MAKPSQSPGAEESNAMMMQGSPLQSEVALIMPAFKEIDGKSSEGGSDYGQRAQWLRAAVLGANDGLVSTASLMMGIGAVKEEGRAMVLSGLAGLVAGACSMAIGEFVSVYSQLDIQLSHMKRKRALEASRRSPEDEQSMTAHEPHGSPSNSTNDISSDKKNDTIAAKIQAENISSDEKNNTIASKIQAAFPQSAQGMEEEEEQQDSHDVEDLPNPIQAASASAVSFAIGALVPLLSAAFIEEHFIRLGVVVGVSSLALAAFGALGAYLGKSCMLKSSLRVLVGGWAAMLLTFGMLRLVRSVGI